ncbi:MAG: hypothetical protein E7256_17760 [Lachnospiraceae bacterium]|nr:hypothetical protein [Lachnospiraceae bacterium]
MSKVKMGLRYWLQIFMLPVYLLSFLIPRNKKIWLYGSTFGKRFADNPKYFYLYMNQNHKEHIRNIWITKNRNIADQITEKGYEAYYLYSIRGLWFAAVGSVYFYDNYSKDISFWLSGGARKVNLWHGIPLKKINMDNIYDSVRHPKGWKDSMRYWLRRLSDEKPSHYVLTTSCFLSEIFASAFATKNVIIAGYPRNDSLYEGRIKDEFKEASEIVNWIYKRKEEGNRIILYMPTFRESEMQLFDVLDFNELHRFLEKNQMYLCIKLHPKSNIKIRLEEICKDIHLDRIKLIGADTDPYEILGLADQLLTDYSSIYFDYLLLERPIVFFPYDYEEYLQHSRELYFPYDDFTPGIKAMNMLQLQEAFLEEDRYQEKRKEIKKKMFDYSEEIASELLYKRIIHMLSS